MKKDPLGQLPLGGAKTPPVRRKPAAKDRELTAEERLHEKLEDRRLQQDWRKRQPVTVK